MRPVIGLLVLTALAGAALAQELERTIEAPEARQGVAVDARYVYGIGNTIVSKRDKFTGELLATWEADDTLPLIHLNSGIVLDGKLICAHSNHSELPQTSSVEIWDTATLEHIGSHSFGILYGSLTWLDRHDGFWWACFAHYDGNGGYPDKDHTFTRLVKFNDAWQRVESWVFPTEVLKRFRPHSASGGAWGPDGRLYVTGHDRPEMYALSLPRAGSVLQYEGTIPIRAHGQAFAFERTGTGLIYGIIRKQGVIVAEPLRLDPQRK